jgi:hypothetical protein
MITKTVHLLFFVAISANMLVSGHQDEQRLQENASLFMMKKLDASRTIVGGLAMENFAQISEAAQDLMLLSQEAEWNVIQAREYFQLSSEFRASAARLRDSASDKNLDGSTLAFFEVTLNCVRCHKYVRSRTK